LWDHANRLLESAEVFGFRDLPWTTEQVVEAVKQTVRANDFADCYIRPLLFLDGGGWNLNVDGGVASVSIAVWEWGNYLGEEALEKGIRANVSSFTRHQPNVMMTKAKIAGNYPNSILAKTESVRLGFDEAIMLNPQGFVAECTGENIFVVRKSKILTPPLVDILEGITRESLITIAEDMGYEVVETPISRDQLYVADEVFVCGTAAEVIGLSEIDFRTIGAGKTGPVTRDLQKAFHDVIRGKKPQYESWVDYVNNRSVPVNVSQSSEVSAD
jgi:branched-chain amino acid aminotransferase